MNKDQYIEKYDEKFYKAACYCRSMALKVDQMPSITLANRVLLGLSDHEPNTHLERVRELEAMAYGDPGVLLALPSPSLAGLLIDEIGTPEQKNYIRRFCHEKKSTSFFALTERHVGSNAAEIQTMLKPSSEHIMQLNGQKFLISHGADAQIGIVVARIAPGPMGIVSILLTKKELNTRYLRLKRHELSMFGLKGIRLAQISFDGMRVHNEQILGMHLSPIRRGFLAVLKVFEKMRPGVGAMALGLAQAMIDYVQCEIKLSMSQKKCLSQLNESCAQFRAFMHYKVESLSQEEQPHNTSSLIKVSATELLKKNSYAIFKMLGKVYLSHPLLLKWQRDVAGFEFMEGTSNMQYMQMCHGYQKKNGLLIKSSGQVHVA